MFKSLASSLLAAALFLSPALAEDAARQRLITLNGHGEVKAAPDMAIVEFGSVTQAATAKAALEANNKKMAALLALLKTNGIDDKDVQTSGFNVGPRYGNDSSQPPKVIGYEVTNTVTATVRKLDALGGLLDAVVNTGANQINGISFGLADTKPLQDEARKAAVAEAAHKADVLTAAANVKLGALVSVSESGGGVPFIRTARMEAPNVAMASAAAPVPVAQGQLTISEDVNMVWELQ